jgi:ribonuclease HI
MALVSWNCHGFYQHVSDLKDIINRYHPICIALQETFLHEAKTAKIRNYSSFRKDYAVGDRPSGGVALLTSHDYPCSPVPLQTDLQAVAVKIHIRTLVTICSIYLPPSKNINKNSLSSLITQLPQPFILLGDFNGHNPLWGSPSINQRGNLIEQLITDHNLCLFNKEEITHFHFPSRTYHSLDLAICSPQTFQFWNFQADSNLYNSDHFPIILSDNTHINPNQRPSRYIFNSADWNVFPILANITSDMVENCTIDEAVQKVTSTIIYAADCCIRKSCGRIRRQTKPWWNQDCKNTYKEQRKAWNKFKRYPTTDNLIHYKKCKGIFRRTLRRSQKDSWARFVNSITSSITSKQMWDKVRRSSGVFPNNQINILHFNNQTISSLCDIANTIASSFASISQSTNYSNSFTRYKTTAEKKRIKFNTNLSLSYNSDFTKFELRRALQNTNNTSAGPDGISYSMIKNLSDSSLSNLLSLYNRIWQENVFPNSWRLATVIPILKPNKDPTNPLNYRPIALTSCLSKILEKMICSRLNYYIEINNCLSIYQSGFRRGRSTIDNIIALEEKVRNAFVKRHHLVSIFFDMEKAYDRTWRYGILRQLHNFNLKGNLPIFIENFLAKRYFKVQIGNCQSNVYEQEEGVPQGSVLSVYLFTIAIDSILREIPPSVSGSLYVDDLHISCEGADMRYIERQLQATINKIVKWADMNGFSFSPTKTCAVHFCRKRGIHPDPDIHVAGSTIKVCDEVKFLGVIFDKKLTFTPHIIHLRKKCERSLNILRVLSNTSWGADRTCLMQIYKSLIRSKLDYGSVVYGSARKSTLKRLNAIHHSALRLCCGAFRTSPVESLYVDCGETPLNNRREILSLQYYFRILSHSNHPYAQHTFSPYLDRLYRARTFCIPPFHRRIDIILKDFKLDNTDILVTKYYRPPWEMSNFNFLNPFKSFDKAFTADIVFQQLFYHHRQSFISYTPIFTDGSKSDDFVGCAYVIGDIIYSYKLHAGFSIFSTELLAIFKALEDLTRHKEKRFILYTDSLSSLHSLSSPNYDSHPLIFYIRKLLDVLIADGFSILFCWVPSHVGIRGNELADSAAKSANNALTFALPYGDLKSYVKRLSNAKWQELWDQQTLNKLHTVKPNIKQWPFQSQRKWDVAVTRLRIGHTRYTHRHLLCGDPAPMCQSCNVGMTVKHILTECKDFTRHRCRHFGQPNVSMTDLLGFNPHRNLFNFLKDIGFYPHI